MESRIIKLNKVYAVLFHIALTTTIFQLICPIYTLVTNIRVDYICIVAMLVIFFIEIAIIGIQRFVRTFYDVLKTSKIIILTCGLYFIWDTINLLYANDLGFLLDKYLIWAKIAIVCVCMFFYVNPVNNEKNTDRNRANDILLNLGLSNFAVCIVAMVGYYTGIFTMRVRMITTISDHNVFSSMIMIGFISLCYVILFNMKTKLYIKIAYLILNMIVCVPVMYLSASRRTIVLLWIFLAWFLVFATYKIMKNHRVESIFIRVSAILVAVLVIAVGSIYQIHFFNEYSTKEYAKIEKNINHRMKNKEVRVEEYVDTIADGTGLDLRKSIWEASIKWYAKMEPVNKIIGGGASYQSDIFNDIDHPINAELVEHYQIKKDTTRWMGPHNFLLEDLLTGGILKVILDFGIMISILVYLIKFVKIDSNYAILILSLYVTLLMNLMMGGKYGIFGDRLTWIVIATDIVTRYSVSSNYSAKLRS